MAAKIVFASANRNKLAEIKAIFPANYELLCLDDIHFTEEIEEYGKTLEENAEIKAAAVYDACGYTCFADDSGLEVEALGGEPGVRSARYAGEPSDAERNMDKLLDSLQGEKKRKARFRTIICMKTATDTFFFEGIIEGFITESRRGTNGFGYDPVFQPAGYTSTFAEMTLEEKNKISHRKIALRKMADFLQYI